jgi:multicomponent Na+:H+ antiporter subunit A
MASSSPTGETPPTSRLVALALVPATLFVLAWRALDGGFEARWPWIPSLGLEFGIHIDGLALQFIALITGVGTAVFVYGAGYLAGDPKRKRIFGFLVAFMAAMLGCVTSTNLLSLFIFWELTSVISFLLVGTKHEYEATRKSAQQALMITGAGGLALLAGILLLGEIAGTYDIPAILASSEAWLDHPWVPAALLCLFAGAFTKSAQFPFHFWLPNAMAAPTPVSAYLHSATMVKLGVYLLARLHPAFGDLALWQGTLVVIGGLTSTWAMVLAVKERDLKRILAWSTVSALGTLVMVIGLPGQGAATAAATFLLAHALYKAPLFFVAGNVDIAAGTRDIDKLAALGRRMPYTALAALLAGASMSGLPLSYGFIAKDIIKLAKTQAEVVTWVAWSGVFVGAASVAAAGVATIRVFWHDGGEAVPSEIHEVPWSMRIPPLVIAATGIVFGVAPWLATPLLAASADAMHTLDDLAAFDVHPDAPGWIAVAVTFVLGLVMFAAWDPLHRFQSRFWLPTWLTLAHAYERFVAAIPRAAAATVRLVQHGRARSYAQLSVGFLALGLIGVLAVLEVPRWPSYQPTPAPIIGASLALVGAAITVCVVRDRLLLLLAGGLAGLACALVFLFGGAPDVAFTQLTVEVALVVVIASVLLRVRRIGASGEVLAEDSTTTGERPRDRPGLDPFSVPRTLVSLATGLTVAALLLASVMGPFDPAIPQSFAARSVPEAHGHNVVNVILVDFRAFDTFGEVCVLVVAGLALLPLFASLRSRRKAQANAT